MDAPHQELGRGAYAPQPHFSHSQTSHVQDSPLQSLHWQASKWHAFAQTSRAEQQPPRVASVVAACVVWQPQSSHVHTSQVQDSPLQSGQLQFWQPQDLLLTDSLLAVANSVDASTSAKPMKRAAKAYLIWSFLSELWKAIGDYVH